MSYWQDGGRTWTRRTCDVASRYDRLARIASAARLTGCKNWTKSPRGANGIGLTIRASASGRSAEAEARENLATACSPRRAAEWRAGLGKPRLARTPKAAPGRECRAYPEGSQCALTKP